MEKYVAYRLETQEIENNVLVNGFYVWGQRESDLNWDTLYKYDTREEAVDFLLYKKSKGYYVYDECGYGL